MPDFSSPDWTERAGALWEKLPEAPGAEGTVSLAIALAPRKEVAFHWRYDGGRPVSGGPGANGDADTGGPAVAFTITAAEAPDVLSGQVEPSVAFMRGRLKASGDGGLLLAFLASTTTNGFSAWRSALAEL
jgi:putative sterol carrier protein